MRVLLTGGAGYIGSHIAQAMEKSSFEPVVYDNLSTGHRWAVRWGPWREGDLADGATLHAALQDYRVEAVVHLAANAYVDESMANPQKYFRNNVVNSLNLLDAILETGVKYMVFSSSCAVYGLPECLPIPEDHLQRPVNPYGETKLFMERMLRWYGEAYGLRWVALRYFNAAGADPGGEIGEAHDPETHLIPRAIQAALGRRPHLEVYGTDYPTADGTALRDYIHVSDLAEAHLLALRYLLEGGESVALNLGIGQGHSVREVIAAVERAGGREVPVQEGPRRAGDPPILVAKAQRARQLLGWEPHSSDLSTVVETAWRWHERQG